MLASVDVPEVLVPAVTVRVRWPHGSLSFIRLVRLLLLLVLELQRWPGVCSCGSSHRLRGRLPCIIMHMEEQEAIVSLVLSGHNVFFQGARRQSIGKSVVMRTQRKKQLPLMMGKLLPQRFTTATGLAHGSATLIALAKCSRTTKPVNRLGLGRRGCCWWTGPSAKCSWCALHVLEGWISLHVLPVTDVCRSVTSK